MANSRTLKDGAPRQGGMPEHVVHYQYVLVRLQLQQRRGRGLVLGRCVLGRKGQHISIDASQAHGNGARKELHYPRWYTTSRERELLRGLSCIAVSTGCLFTDPPVTARYPSVPAVHLMRVPYVSAHEQSPATARHPSVPAAHLMRGPLCPAMGAARDPWPTGALADRPS